MTILILSPSERFCYYSFSSLITIKMYKLIMSLFLSTVIVIYGQYSQIEAEVCPSLHSSSSLFDFLLPCAKYTTTNTTLTCLSKADEKKDLEALPGWTLTEDKVAGDSIFRSYLFDDFQHAFLFMTEGAQLAETNQHHPDWRNLYNQVDVTLTTDDVPCLSTFDISLAHGLDLAYNRVIGK